MTPDDSGQNENISPCRNDREEAVGHEKYETHVSSRSQISTSLGTNYVYPRLYVSQQRVHVFELATKFGQIGVHGVYIPNEQS